MKHTNANIKPQSNVCSGIDTRVAYHLAGYAAAIYLGNKQKQLPSVYFQIIVAPQESDGRSNRITNSYEKYITRIEGGRLLQSLPLSLAEIVRDYTQSELEKFLCAFEADYVNLLAGLLAEAKYVASRDGEVFNANLINLDALRFYGGSSEQNVLIEYIACLSFHKTDREQKMSELFSAAFGFINQPSNWHAIRILAEFIGDGHKGTINSEDVISLLESPSTMIK